MFLFQSTAQKKSQQEPGKAHQMLIPYENFTPQMKQWLAAVETAANGLEKTVAGMTKKLSPNIVYFGPNMLDTSFFYRLMPGQTSHSLEDYLDEEHFAFKHRLPFVQRDVDFINNPANFANASSKTREQRSDFLDAFKKPEFSRAMVSEEEFGLLGRLIYDGRQEGVKGRGILFCVKHFPGESNVSMGITHDQEVSSPISLKGLYSGPMKPFLDILQKSEVKPTMVMMGHVAYPIAEKELRVKHPGLPELFPLDLEVPATLSPYMVRGLLREDLGYEGLISCDSIAMDAIEDYVRKKLPNLPEEYHEFHNVFASPKGTLIFILSVYAGINHVVGFGENGAIPDTRNIKKYYETEKEFQLLFDNLAFETLFLKIKNMPGEIRPQDLPDLGGISLKDLKLEPELLPKEKRDRLKALKKLLEGNNDFMKKLDVLLTNGLDYRPSKCDRFGFARFESKSDPSVEKVLTYYAKYDDLWNRGGLLDMKFRQFIIKELLGAKGAKENEELTNVWITYLYSNPIDWRFSEPDSKLSADRQLDNLFANPDFRKAYENMDWNSTEWRSVFEEYARRQKTDWFKN